MPVVPSLTLWSSIKIPYPIISPRELEDGIISASLSDSYPMSHVTGGNMVNLKVPNGLSNGKENLSPNLISCSCVHKKKSSIRTSRKHQKISFVTVPEICFYPEHDYMDFKMSVDNKKISLKSSSRDYSEDDLSVEEEYTEFLLKGRRKKRNHIPSVKRCTLEELREINRQYNMMEERIKKIIRKKKKRKEIDSNSENATKPAEEKPATPEKSPSSESSNKDSESNDLYYDCVQSEMDLNTEREVLKDYDNLQKALGTREMLKLADRSYYEMKLTQLYMIELGVNL